jgi:hypothetical protein
MSFFKTKGNRHRLLILATAATGSQGNGVAVFSYYLTPVLKLVGVTDAAQQTGINGGMQIWNLILAGLGASMVEKLGRRKIWLIGTLSFSFSFPFLLANPFPLPHRYRWNDRLLHLPHRSLWRVRQHQRLDGRSRLCCFHVVRPFLSSFFFRRETDERGGSTASAMASMISPGLPSPTPTRQRSFPSRCAPPEWLPSFGYGNSPSLLSPSPVAYRSLRRCKTLPSASTNGSTPSLSRRPDGRFVFVFSLFFLSRPVR